MGPTRRLIVISRRPCSPLLFAANFRAYAQAATTHTTQSSLYPIQLSKHKQHTTSKEYIQVQDPSKHEKYSSDFWTEEGSGRAEEGWSWGTCEPTWRVLGCWQESEQMKETLSPCRNGSRHELMGQRSEACIGKQRFDVRGMSWQSGGQRWNQWSLQSIILVLIIKSHYTKLQPTTK